MRRASWRIVVVGSRRSEFHTALGRLCKTPEVMSTFKDRLLEEKAQLDERRAKLEAFQQSEAFQGIEPMQMTLLNIQAQAMATYSQCLLERLAWLEPKAVEA